VYPDPVGDGLRCMYRALRWIVAHTR
jgi:hypothetical protein